MKKVSREKPLNIPPHLDEKQVLQTIERVINKVAPTFVFGYYSLEDIKQEARIACLEALADYNPSLPLANFLRIHLKYRMLNLWRNKFQRNDPPCKHCHLTCTTNKRNECTDAKEQRTELCDRYNKWYANNSMKKNIVKPIDLSNVTEMTGDINPIGLDAEIDELITIIDDRLSLEERLLLLKKRDGVKLDKHDDDLLYNAVKRALEGKCTLNEDR